MIKTIITICTRRILNPHKYYYYYFIFLTSGMKSFGRGYAVKGPLRTVNTEQQLCTHTYCTKTQIFFQVARFIIEIKYNMVLLLYSVSFHEFCQMFGLFVVQCSTRSHTIVRRYLRKYIYIYICVALCIIYFTRFHFIVFNLWQWKIIPRQTLHMCSNPSLHCSGVFTG